MNWNSKLEILVWCSSTDVHHVSDLLRKLMFPFYENIRLQRMSFDELRDWGLKQKIYFDFDVFLFSLPFCWLYTAFKNPVIKLVWNIIVSVSAMPHTGRNKSNFFIHCSPDNYTKRVFLSQQFDYGKWKLIYCDPNNISQITACYYKTTQTKQKKNHNTKPNIQQRTSAFFVCITTQCNTLEKKNEWTDSF